MVQIRSRGKPIPAANPGVASNNGKNASDFNTVVRMTFPPHSGFCSRFPGLAGGSFWPQVGDSRDAKIARRVSFYLTNGQVCCGTFPPHSGFCSRFPGLAGGSFWPQVGDSRCAGGWRQIQYFS
jgi:hypothetical protein